MPFDFPNQGPIGDLDILVDARARVSGENQWIKGRFEDGDRHCLVAALSLACGSRSFNIPNKTERRLMHLSCRSTLARFALAHVREQTCAGTKSSHVHSMILFTNPAG